MSIMRRAGLVIAALLAMGRHEEASSLRTAMGARKRKPRGRKYPPAVQARGGLCTLGSHDAAMRAALIERGQLDRLTNVWPVPHTGRCDRSHTYWETLAELGVRQSCT